MGEEVSGINGGRRWLNRLHKDRIRAMNTEQREEGGLKQRGNKEDEKEEKEQVFFFSWGPLKDGNKQNKHEQHPHPVFCWCCCFELDSRSNSVSVWLKSVLWRHDTQCLFWSAWQPEAPLFISLASTPFPSLVLDIHCFSLLLLLLLLPPPPAPVCAFSCSLKFVVWCFLFRSYYDWITTVKCLWYLFD